MEQLFFWVLTISKWIFRIRQSCQSECCKRCVARDVEMCFYEMCFLAFGCAHLACCFSAQYFLATWHLGQKPLQVVQKPRRAVGFA